MTISTISELMSPDLTNAVNRVKTILLTKLYLAPIPQGQPRQSMAYFRAAYGSYSDLYIMMMAYLKSQRFLSLPTIIEELDSDPSRADHYKRLADKVANYGIQSFQFPNYYNSTASLDKMSTLLDELKLEDRDDYPPDNWCRRIMSVLLEQCDEIVSDFDQYQTSTVQQIIDGVDTNAWKNQHYPHHTDVPTGDAMMDDHHRSLLRLINCLKDPGVPDEAVKFILIDVLGTAGVGYIGTIEFPVGTWVLPPGFISAYGARIWNERIAGLQNLDPSSQDPTSIDDQDIRDAELAFESYSRDLSVKEIREHKTTYSTHVRSDPEAENQGFTYTQRGHPSTRRSSRSQSATPTGHRGRRATRPDTGRSNSAQGQRTTGRTQPPGVIPDDTNYEPDPWMGSKAQEFTEYVNSHPNDILHDHMTRFNVTNEGPQGISRWSTLDGDFFIQMNDVNGTRRYLVTFTRQNKKPIFNQVF